MNRQTPSRSQPPTFPPPGYRTGAAPSFPPVGQLTRGGSAGAAPPGFGSRSTAETSDFPALGSHNSTYASQAQTSSSSSHLPPQQQLFMQGAPGLAPPPPPGIGTSPTSRPNGLGDEFPALSGGARESADRISNYVNLASGNLSPPPSLINGTTSSSATPSTVPPLPGTMDSWGGRTSPSRGVLGEGGQPSVLRPVQQILTSPADKWGLKALLYEIKMSMGKNDRGIMQFGEDLSELGMDINSEEPLYSSLVTPWQDPRSLEMSTRLDENFHLPQCYNVVAPSVQSKIPNFTEDTLLYAFYASPQDTLQLEVAEELYNRGWRYHIEMQVWMNPNYPIITPLPDHAPKMAQGPFIVWDPRTMSRTKTPDDYMVDVSLLEAPRSAHAYIQEQQALKDASKSPTANGNPNGNGNGYGR